MKLIISMITILGFISTNSFGQINNTKNALKENKDTWSVHISNNLTKKEGLSRENKATSYNKKEWKKTKRQIRRNKKRITSSKQEINNKTTLDTIYLKTNNSQITNW